MLKIALLAVFCLVVAVSATSSVHIPEETRMLFSNWVKEHNKSYGSIEETNKRLTIFHDNLQFINSHNLLAAQGLKSYTVAANRFADLTVEEYRVQYLTYRRSLTSNVARGSHTYHPPANVTLPASVDWRTQNVVTPVKDQGQCGSCWSFSATGSMEGAHALATGNLVSLSEQNLVDCVLGGQYTCDTGGEMTDGFQYVINNHGIDTEDSYPYCACSGNTCAYKSSNSGATISGYKTVTQGSEADLQSATATQPGVSIAIDASQQSFQLYSGGVYDEPACSSTQLDHGVLIVGYGVDGGKDYWLVKNSWSASWGLQGYIMMSRNKHNQCGVATDASFPTV